MSIQSDSNFLMSVNIGNKDYRIPSKSDAHTIPTRYYINGSTGNDNNDGSSASPWKTLDRFFELLNQGFTDIRCYIVESGIYDISFSSFTNALIHITSQANNPVYLNFKGQPDIQSEISFYGNHWNIVGSENSPIVFTCDYDTTVTFENAVMTLTNVDLSDFTIVNCFGGTIFWENVTVGRAYFNGTTGYWNDQTVTKWSSGTAIVIRRGSNIAIYGNLNIKGSGSIGSTLFAVERSIAVLQNAAVNTDGITSTGKSITATAGTIYSTDTIVNTRYGSVARGGTNYSSASLVVLTNTVLNGG